MHTHTVSPAERDVQQLLRQNGWYQMCHRTTECPRVTNAVQQVRFTPEGVCCHLLLLKCAVVPGGVYKALNQMKISHFLFVCSVFVFYSRICSVPPDSSFIILIYLCILLAFRAITADSAEIIPYWI